MILFLDNAESILDPQGPNARELYSVVVELSRLSNICLGITSRIHTVPPHCKRPIISTLSIESACDIFYNIYQNGGRSDIISDLVKQLDFHALSITLLATTTAHNVWDYDRLAKEWDIRRAQVLRTDYNESLAAAIELSLTSPTFRKLGPEARDLLGIVAFFPQGVNEDNLDWLFPTISNGKTIFDKFCVLSLTYRNRGYVTMLAPLRDYLTPDPKSSPLLFATKDNYFARMSVFVDPREPGFEEARWITSEDVNVEHLLNIFTSIDAESEVVWNACDNFLAHLYWYKRRFTVLQPKIEGLPDSHHFKSRCLIQLSRLSQSVGNHAGQKRLLTQCLKIRREQKGDLEVASLLRRLSRANSQLGLYAEGIQQVEEAVGVYERFGDTVGQAKCWNVLSVLLRQDNQPEAAEEAGSRAINLLPENGQEFLLCKFHKGLGKIYQSNGKREKALHHLEASLAIASAFKWRDLLARVNYSLAELFLDEGKFEDASDYLKQAKTYIADSEYEVGTMKEMQAKIWYRQGKLEDATSETLGALGIYEKLGASRDEGDCKVLLQKIEQAMAGRLLGTTPIYTLNNSPFPERGTP